MLALMSKSYDEQEGLAVRERPPTQSASESHRDEDSVSQVHVYECRQCYHLKNMVGTLLPPANRWFLEKNVHDWVAALVNNRGW